VSDGASATEHRILILAPSGRDAALGAQALEQAGVASVVCDDAEALLAGIRAGAGAAMVANEALSAEVRASLTALLRNQPTWSDFPLLILIRRTTTAVENRRAMEVLSDLGNVTALERPIHPLMLLSAAQAALRARKRQYAARAVLEEREREVRQRDQFMALLGHELRNPLGALRNAATLVERSGAGLPDLKRPLAIIDRQLHHLSQLVDDLLDVARVTSGKIALKLEPVDLVAVIRSLIEEIRRSCRERGLAMSFEASEPRVFVRGDPVRIEQIANNLLTNAVKYTPPGGRIDVSVTGGAAATLRVSDTGVGISAELLPNIFNPFTQAAHSLDRSQGGMGLGLSVVRALVQLHGGEVSVASAGLGRGAEFTVTLPAAAVDEAEARGTASSPPIAGVPRHILIVEDGDDNRESLQQLLEEEGHQVATAVDGAQGVECALSLRPEVALVDIGLPRLDGYEVARRIREAMGSDIFLIALTGYGQPEDRARAAAAGFDVHLIKPVDVDALDRLLAGVKPSRRSTTVTAS
jgi:signal transduction histidine kinase/ActR/RegA family two-component response regulator